MVRQLIHVKNRFLEFYQRHEVLVSMATFSAGFLLDIYTLRRIDNLFNLIQQAVYLLILGAILLCDIKIRTNRLILSEKEQKFWNYHDLVVNFLFGSLLRANTIFYFVSASAIASFIFILLLAGLMLANEIPKIQRLGLPVRIILYSICLLSYFSFFYPILMGHMGPLPFWLGFLSSLAVITIIWQWNFSKAPELKRNILYPALLIHGFFLFAYYTSLIPPVPMAIKKMGVYYSVEKKEGRYLGAHLRPFWDIWTAQKFQVRPGDKINILLSVFSPARFDDQIFLKWYFKDPKQGWRLEDSIPLSILGGRDEGFRGYGHKLNYKMGLWRVKVETSDKREVGRIDVEIEEDKTISERIFYIDSF